MKEIIDYLKKYTDGKQNTEKVEISVIQLNRVIKALEQELKTGHWIDHSGHIECEKCRTWFLKSHLFRNSYCPNCGAKMVEPQERRSK